ncbi:hypothetical protein AC578_9104 [Pseudocercospora eumusae]|uniref:Uncharacterized protein n=1 Tax=Pseudocercospora eumusae TaxID=321146 RepID=A0A139HV43_9PEZI|nr:hypothetical protein AC578_9104 [Pseudocercospora eumusae]
MPPPFEAIAQHPERSRQEELYYIRRPECFVPMMRGAERVTQETRNHVRYTEPFRLTAVDKAEVRSIYQGS